MQLTSLRPFSTQVPMFQRRLGQLFNELFDGGNELAQIETALTPPLDVMETEDSIVVKLEIPGMDVKDIEVTVQGEELRVRGEKHQEKEEKGKAWRCVERSYGSFYRTVSLPTAVKAEAIKAEAKNGVLTVTLPKSPEAHSTKIPIKTA